jgi:two-component system cell cycle response regulator CpdR
MARILIAEDEDSLRSLVQRALMLDGHDVAVAPDGAEALDILTRRKGDIELLLADIKMPIMDGIALALAAGRDYPDLIILLMTGYADQRERAHGLDALVHDVITKPFTLVEIRQAVSGALAAAARLAR